MSFDAENLPLPRPCGTQAPKDSSQPSQSLFSLSPASHQPLGRVLCFFHALTSIKINSPGDGEVPRPKDPALVVEWKDACPESNLPGWRLMLTVQSSLWVGDSWNELLPPGPHSVC